MSRGHKKSTGKESFEISNGNLGLVTHLLEKFLQNIDFEKNNFVLRCLLNEIQSLTEALPSCSEKYVGIWRTGKCVFN